MTANKFIDAFKRMLTMTLALIMVLGTVIQITTQEASAFDGKKGSKYTVTDGGRITYGSEPPPYGKDCNDYLQHLIRQKHSRQMGRE